MTLADLEKQADDFMKQGDAVSVSNTCLSILKVDENHLPALDFLSNEAMEKADFENAEKYLIKLTTLVPENFALQNKLGFVLEEQDKFKQALAAYGECWKLDETNPTIYLYIGYLYMKMGQEDQAAQVFSLGDDIDGRIIRAYQNEGIGEKIRVRSKAAHDILCKILTNLHVDTLSSMAHKKDVNRIWEAIWPQVDNRSFTYKNEMQRPELFYIPHLDDTVVFRSEDLDWAEELQGQYEEIKTEILANLSVDEDGEPYLNEDIGVSGEDWDRIVKTMNWAAVHFYKRGVANEETLKKYPKTVEALKKIPLADMHGLPMEAFISILKPRTKIPPHFGVSNSPLTVHFPLVVPGDCALKAGNETCRHVEGEVFAFDDSYLHEAWNNTDEPRIVLIFELWHPDLTEAEKQAVRATFSARQKWLDKRSVGIR